MAHKVLSAVPLLAGARLVAVWALLGATALMVAPDPAAAQATPYVPTLDPAYRDLDVLLLQGGEPDVILGQRPYSRMTFARVAWAARQRLAGAGGSDPGGSAPWKPRVTEALERLERDFAAELALLCTAGSGDCPAFDPYLELRRGAVDASWADTPPRPVRTQLLSGVAADINPLLQRNQGRVLADGATLGGEAAVDFRLGARVAGAVHPRLWLAQGEDPSAQGGATLVRGYVRGVFGNLAVDVGRNPVTHGAAREAGPVLSHNARGLDMVRLSMERPGRLPWIFRRLGPVGFAALVGDMGDNQDTPGSKLIVLEGVFRPHPNLEVGGAVLNHQGGGVGPPAGLGERLRDVFFLLPRRPFYFLPPADVQSDKAVAFDVRLSLPRLGAEAYAEVITTDDHDLFWGALEQGLWHDAAWTWGVRALGLGGEGRLDSWVEVSRVGLLPYTHHEFTGGMAVDRRILGSPLGPLGTGVQAGVDWTGAHQDVALAAAWERYSGDTYRNPDDGLSRRHRSADNPDEIRLRVTGSWTRRPPAGGLQPTLHLGYEHVTRFGLGSGGRDNVIAQLRIGYVP